MLCSSHVYSGLQAPEVRLIYTSNYEGTDQYRQYKWVSINLIFIVQEGPIVVAIHMGKELFTGDLAVKKPDHCTEPRCKNQD